MDATAGGTPIQFATGPCLEPVITYLADPILVGWAVDVRPDHPAASDVDLGDLADAARYFGRKTLSDPD